MKEESGSNQRISPPLPYSCKAFDEGKKASRKANGLLLPCGGQTGWDFSKRFGLFSYLKWLGRSQELLVEKCNSMPGIKETDQISAFPIKWEERLVRSVQLAFLTARSPVFTGNQADVKCSLCKYYSPAFPALLFSWSWRRRDSSSLAASRKIDWNQLQFDLIESICSEREQD